MKIELQLFAAARHLCGQDSLSLELEPGATVGDLRKALAMCCPAIESLLPHVRFAIRDDYVRDGTVLEPGATVACIPPVSGG